MLKIRDDIDLKELEKFGLRQQWNYKTRMYDGNWECGSFKVCKNRHILPFNGTNHNRYDKIYDLIQANLVEKVSDKNV